MIKIENLNFSYKNNENILSNIDLGINKGKITTIIGKNASGKSTLLDIIIGKQKKYTGQVFIKDKNIRNYSARDLAKTISVVFQKNIAPEELSIKQFLSYARHSHKKSIFSKDTLEDKEKISRAIELVELEDIQDKKMTDLSGGQLQRVHIALALAQDTEIMILDEVTSYLDIKYQQEIMKLILHLNKELGKTIVMVLHDINQALTYSHEIIAIKNNQILYHKPTSFFYNKDILKNIFDCELKVDKEKKLIISH